MSNRRSPGHRAATARESEQAEASPKAQRGASLRAATEEGNSADSKTALDAPFCAGYPEGLQKCPTGVSGLDEVTGGGLPKGRPTLVCGGAGSGKTMMGIEFLARGAMNYNEPGVLMVFEESANDLIVNVASMGIDLKKLVARKMLRIDPVRLERAEIEEAGEFDLEGLFIRLNEAIDSIGAKRVVLDTIELLFASLTNHGILRAELRRLFGWLKDKGVTTIVTGERGDGGLTRYGLEEYVADCVILLDTES